MAAHDPYLGSLIPEASLELVERLGEGTMGVVYRAVHEGSGADFVVKILDRTPALEHGFAERFEREMMVLPSLRHPNTVRILDHGEMEDSSLYIVMELLQGRGLDAALRSEGPWSIERAISMVLRVAYALEEAHRLGIVHGGLKPENIFLVPRPGGVEIPMLLDFSLARIFNLRDSNGVEAMPWTSVYMPPEQAFGQLLDARTDVYSLAVILYELLTGLRPFGVERPSSILRFLDELIPIDQRVEGLTFPPDLWPVLARALHKLPEDRYSSAMEFAEAVAPFNTAQISIQSPTVHLRSTPAPPLIAQKIQPPNVHLKSTPAPPLIAQSKPPPGRREAPGTRRMPVVGALVVAAVLLAGAILFVLLR